MEDKRNREKEESEYGDGINGKKIVDPVMLKKKAKKNDNAKNSNYVMFYRA